MSENEKDGLIDPSSYKIPEEEYLVPIGKAKVTREGEHLTSCNASRIAWPAMDIIQIIFIF